MPGAGGAEGLRTGQTPGGPPRDEAPPGSLARQAESSGACGAAPAAKGLWREV